MHSTINERNSDIDDISVNTNLKVFNGGLGLAKNHKREQNHSQQKKHEINKMQKFTKEFHDPKEKIFKEYNNINNNNNSKNTNPKFKETNLADKENLIEAEGIISFRSKKVTRNENEAENVDINVLTSGIINKIDKLHLKSNKKDARNLLPTNTNNNSNANEEHTINKIFKLNDERETEKEIKNFEKESQRIQSRILAGNPLESSSSEFSEEEFERNDGYNTHKIKRTLDDIHMKNVNKNGKYTRGVVKNGNHSNYNNDNKPINNYNKNYNTIGGDERINNLNSNVFDDSRNQNSFRNDGGDVNEKNIFWNLRGNNNANVNEDLEKSNYYHTLKRSRSAIDKEFGSVRHSRSRRQEKETPISSFKGTLSKIEKGYAIFVTTDDVIMLLPSFLIPRNLGIGDSFNFKVFESQKYNNKINNIYDIQKKYTKSIGK